MQGDAATTPRVAVARRRNPRRVRDLGLLGAVEWHGDWVEKLVMTQVLPDMTAI